MKITPGQTVKCLKFYEMISGKPVPVSLKEMEEDWKGLASSENQAAKELCQAIGADTPEAFFAGVIGMEEMAVSRTMAYMEPEEKSRFKRILEKGFYYVEEGKEEKRLLQTVISTVKVVKKDPRVDTEKLQQELEYLVQDMCYLIKTRGVIAGFQISIQMDEDSV